MEWTEKEVDELFRLIDRYEALFEKLEFESAHLHFNEKIDTCILVKVPVSTWRIIKNIKEGRILFNKIIKRGVKSCPEKKKHSGSKKRIT